MKDLCFNLLFWLFSLFLYSLFFTPYNYFKLIFWLLIFPEKLGKVKYYRASQVASLNDPDNHDGVVIHLKSDILEREVKWALGSITTNRASEVMEFQLSYFKS